MAAAEVYGAPGLPGAALHHGNFDFPAYNNHSIQSLKRSFAAYTSNTDEIATRGSSFDPNKHLVYEGPTKVHTMEDIGYAASKGVSPVAVSEPFQLFSDEAIMEMRKEIFADKVMNDYSYTSDIAPKQLRGYAPK
jgi:hypothetical protein